jgi:simple sugar transport system permease protein
VLSEKTLKKVDPHIAVLAVITLGVFVVLGILLRGQFFSLRNFQSMAYQFPEFGFLALAMMIAMITGGIDLSVIANANLSGIVAAFILTKMITPEMGTSDILLMIGLAIFAGLSVSLMCGLMNGMLIAFIGIPAILATLGTMTFYTGIGMAITEGVGVVGFPDQFLFIGSGKVGSIPIPLLMFIIIAIILALILNKTVFGQSLYLFGANPIATLFSGINNAHITIKAYLMSGLLAGCSSIIMISRVNSAKVGYGDTYLLQAILVAVLGGVNPYGGRGKVIGVVMGIIMLQSLQNAFTLFMFTPYAKKLIWGLMLLLVMIIHFINMRYQERAKIRAMAAQM